MLFLDRVDRPDDAHDVGAVRALPPRRVRRTHHRVRRASRLVTPMRLWCELAWLGGDAAAAGVRDRRSTASGIVGVAAGGVEPPPRRRPARRPRRCRAWPTPTATPSTARCAAARTAAAARSGRGASRCTRSPSALTPTSYHAPGRGDVRRDGAGRHHRASASSTTSTTARRRARTTTATRWARR